MITDLDADQEVMNPVLTWPGVSTNGSVQTSFTPILRAYINTKYKDGDVVEADLAAVDPIWQNNLLNLTTDTIVLIKKRANGRYVAQAAEVNTGDEGSDGAKLPPGRAPPAAVSVCRAHRAFAIAVRI